MMPSMATMNHATKAKETEQHRKSNNQTDYNQHKAKQKKILPINKELLAIVIAFEVLRFVSEWKSEHQSVIFNAWIDMMWKGSHFLFRVDLCTTLTTL